MSHTQPALGLNITLNTGDMTSAQARVTAALKAEGFGVLTEIDVQSTLKTKIDVDFRPYKILGACNPSLAHRALSSAPEVGLLLPCNVTLSQTDSDSILVSIVDPLVMLDIVTHEGLKAVAQEAAERLRRVADALSVQE